MIINITQMSLIGMSFLFICLWIVFCVISYSILKRFMITSMKTYTEEIHKQYLIRIEEIKKEYERKLLEKNNTKEKENV